MVAVIPGPRLDSREGPVTAVEFLDHQPAMIERAHVIHSDPAILGGTPVFVGTRVPAQSYSIIWKALRRWMSFCANSHQLRMSKP